MQLEASSVPAVPRPAKAAAWAKKGMWLSAIGGAVGLVALVQPWAVVNTYSEYGPLGSTKVWLWDLPNISQWVFPGGDPVPAMAAAVQPNLNLIMLAGAIVLLGSLLCILKPMGPIGPGVILVGAVVSAVELASAHTSVTIPGGVFGTMSFSLSLAPEIGSDGAFLAGILALAGYILRAMGASH